MSYGRKRMNTIGWWCWRWNRKRGLV